LTNVQTRPILESSRTTYFDNLTGLQKWIGRTPGRVKDQRSAWVTWNNKGESHGKWRL